MDTDVQDNSIASKVEELSDLELAALLCFIADQHCCIIQAEAAELANVAKELELVYALYTCFVGRY